jgi:replication factor C subunit 2/4
MKERLTMIAQTEGCSDEELVWIEDIVQSAQGDMRRAVTILQSVHSLTVGSQSQGLSDASHLVTSDVIAEIAGMPPTYVMDTVWEAVASARYDRMHTAVQAVLAEGYAGALLVSALLTPICNSDTLTERHKADLAIRLAEAEKNIVEGADEYLQLMTVTSLAVSCFAQCGRPSSSSSRLLS